MALLGLSYPGREHHGGSIVKGTYRMERRKTIYETPTLLLLVSILPLMQSLTVQQRMTCDLLCYPGQRETDDPIAL